MGVPVVSVIGRMIAMSWKNPLAALRAPRKIATRGCADGRGTRPLLDLIGSSIDRIRRLADRMETLGD